MQRAFATMNKTSKEREASDTMQIMYTDKTGFDHRIDLIREAKF